MDPGIAELSPLQLAFTALDHFPLVPATIGLAAALCVVLPGDRAGGTAGEHQRMQITAIEAQWETRPPPAGFNLIAWPDMAARMNRAEAGA